MANTKRKRPAINTKNVNKYITEGLLCSYKDMAETEIVRVPPVIYDLLVFAGELEELRENETLVKSDQIAIGDKHWLNDKFSLQANPTKIGMFDNI